ncbi:MAG: RNA pyrophosphohydrolase [Hyphomicrobiaceae bacterium]
MAIAREFTEAPDRQSMPYRIGVGIALFDEQGRLWLGRRLPKWCGDSTQAFWQMPQGGIERGELPLAAAMRELTEETGARAFVPIAEIGQWLTYEVPDDMLGVALKGRYRGQRQRWFAMRFTGRDRDFDLRRAEKKGGKAEFDAWRWATLEEAVAGIVPWKREVYSAVAEAFAPLSRCRVTPCDGRHPTAAL